MTAAFASQRNNRGRNRVTSHRFVSGSRSTRSMVNYLVLDIRVPKYLAYGNVGLTVALPLFSLTNLQVSILSQKEMTEGTYIPLHPENSVSISVVSEGSIK